MKQTLNLIVFSLIVILLVITTKIFAQNSIRITPINPSLGSTSIYDIDFILRDSLTAYGAISIVFPKEFDLSNVNIAASSFINGGLSTIVKGQEVIIVRKGEGDLKKLGEKVDIKLSAVRNPNVDAGNYILKLFIHKDGKRIHKQIKDQEYKLESNNKSIEGSFSLSTNQ